MIDFSVQLPPDLQFTLLRWNRHNGRWSVVVEAKALPLEGGLPASGTGTAMTLEDAYDLAILECRNAMAIVAKPPVPSPAKPAATKPGAVLNGLALNIVIDI